MRALLVEDNRMIAKGLTYSLEQKGYEVFHTETVKDTIFQIKQNKMDIIILDVSLPDGNGFTLYETEIKPRKIPTIFLTALDEEDDIVKGLELGAEDYLTKPFSTKELMARMNKILGKGKNQKVQVQNITFDMDKMEAYYKEERIELSNIERRILHLLFMNLNKVVTREDLIEKIWDWTGNDVNNNTVTVYLKRIREKIKDDIILTIKGIGYRIDEK